MIWKCCDIIAIYEHEKNICSAARGRINHFHCVFFFLLLSLKLVSVSLVKSDMAWSCSTTWECINFLSAHVVLRS